MAAHAETRTPAPFNIAMLGWARLSMQASDGGGLNLVLSQLAPALVEQGHRVVYLRSGMHYSLRGGMRITPEETWRGVECHELINSPNLTTGNFNFENVESQIASPQETSVVIDFLRRARVDVLHVHVLEGFSFDLIGAVRRELRIPVIVTPHNYFCLCPQIDLLHQERRVCDDYDGGRRCEGCLKVPDYRWEMRRRARLHSARRALGDSLYEGLKPIGAAVASALGRFRPSTHERHAFEAPAAPDDGFSESRRPGSPPAHDQLVANRDRHLVVLNHFGRRRAAGVAALNQADAILPPGRFLMKVHEAFGVDAARLHHVPLGLRHLDALREECRRAPDLDAPPWSPGAARPMRLVYFGNCWVNKGLHILVEAMTLLPVDVRDRLELDVYASGDDRAFRERTSGLSNVRFHGAYSPEDQAEALRRADAGVFAGIALENSPLVIMEMLSAGRFVVAPRRGAVLDFIQDARNGCYFEPGDAVDLARALAAIARGDVQLRSRRTVLESTSFRSFEEYVAESLDVYRTARARYAAEPAT